jgi:hypothetical protein
MYAEHSERTATLVAILVTFGCVYFSILVFKAPYRISTEPVATPRRFIDPNEEFHTVPGKWASVNFKYYHFGSYKLSSGKRIILSLNNGEYVYDFSDRGHGWFSLNDVYYFDLTGDQIAEAIVDITHVECGVSCDGGAHLLFIYSMNADGKLEKRFQYETGSYADGCGLKSMTLRWREVDLELFGHCEPPVNDMSAGKFMVKDLTHLLFWISDTGFVPPEIDIKSTDLRDLRGYKPEFIINPRAKLNRG